MIQNLFVNVLPYKSLGSIKEFQNSNSSFFLTDLIFSLKLKIFFIKLDLAYLLISIFQDTT